MRALTLEEFAQDMRRGGDIRQADMADEILALIDIEEEVAEPYGNLCDDLNNAAPKELEDKPEKQMEWVIDRSNMLQDIEKAIEEAAVLPSTGANGLPVQRDTEDAVKELLDMLGKAQDVLEAAGWPGDGDFLEALNGLAERAARAPEEIEVMTYDL
jgi:hypothetical protein